MRRRPRHRAESELVVELVVGLEPPVFAANHLLDVARGACDVLGVDLGLDDVIVVSPEEYVAPLFRVSVPRVKLEPALDVALEPLGLARMDVTGVVSGPHLRELGDRRLAVVGDVELGGVDGPRVGAMVRERLEGLGFDFDELPCCEVVMLVLPKGQQGAPGEELEHLRKRVEFGVGSLWVFDVTRWIDSRPVAGRRLRPLS